ncbi:MAG: EAL domain-containing protein [Lachnospirales bacterium]
MYSEKVKKINIGITLVLSVVLLFQNTVYASAVVKDDSITNKFVYSTVEYIEYYNQVLDETVAAAPKLDLNVEQEMALQKAIEADLVYISYPGIVDLGEESPNIEQFNLEFIRRVLGIDIEFKKCSDYGLENTFDNVEMLLDSTVADFAGFYSYGFEMNEEKEKSYYSTDVYSEQFVYQISRANETDISNVEVSLYEDNIAIDKNIMEVNDYEIVGANNARIADIESGLNMVKQGVIDYYLVESAVIPYINKTSDFLYSNLSDDLLTPGLKTIAKNEEYEEVLNLINQLYTGEVLEKFFNLTQVSIARNRYVIFNNSFTNDELIFIRNSNSIRVGVYESKGIMEKNEENAWQGYTKSFLEEVSALSGLHFTYVDYTDTSLENMLADLATGEIDIIFVAPYELQNEYQNIVDDLVVELKFTKPYFYKKLNILKLKGTTDLNSLKDIGLAKVGYVRQNQEIVEDFMESIFNGVYEKNLKAYSDSDLLYEALENGEVKFVIALPGEKASLVRNGENTIEYAFDYESDVDIQKYNFSFVISNANTNYTELYNLFNRMINTIVIKESNVWFMESVNYKDIVEMSTVNRFLLYCIICISVVAAFIFGIVYFRTRKANKVIFDIMKFDKISGLNNRYAFFENVSLAENEYYCIIITVNNTKGFFESIGKWNITPMLRAIASRMTNLSTDIKFEAYRLAGEDFVLLVEHIDKDAFEKFLALLLASIKMSYQVGDLTLNVDFNVGICESKYADKNLKKMILYAQNMVKYHMENKHLEYAMFTEKDKLAIEEIELIEELINGDLAKSISPYFQPIYDHTEKKMIGVEVLARLSANGVIYPASKFMDIAVKNDRLADIDTLIVDETIRYREFLLERNYINKSFFFSVNVCIGYMKKLDDASILNLKYMNNITGLSFLRFEVPEKTLNLLEADRFFMLLEENDIGVIVNDFSIGHSSLAKIVEHNFKSIKIDKDLLLTELDDKTKQLYTSLVHMLVEMKQHVIAQGIEGREQHDFIRNVEVSGKQGNYFGKAQSSIEFIKKISRSDL